MMETVLFPFSNDSFTNNNNAVSICIVVKNKFEWPKELLHVDSDKKKPFSSTKPNYRHKIGRVDKHGE